MAASSSSSRYTWDYSFRNRSGPLCIAGRRQAPSLLHPLQISPFMVKAFAASGNNIEQTLCQTEGKIRQIHESHHISFLKLKHFITNSTSLTIFSDNLYVYTRQYYSGKHPSWPPRKSIYFGYHWEVYMVNMSSKIASHPICMFTHWNLFLQKQQKYIDIYSNDSWSILTTQKKTLILLQKTLILLLEDHLWQKDARSDVQGRTIWRRAQILTGETRKNMDSSQDGSILRHLLAYLREVGKWREPSTEPRSQKYSGHLPTEWYRDGYPLSCGR